MSKIAIVSNAEEGVVIDISGCDSPAEAKQYLTSTLQVSSRFWEGLTVDLNLGNLPLTQREVGEILSIVREVGVDPTRVLSADVGTVAALYQVTRKDCPDADEVQLESSQMQNANCCNDLPALSVEGQALNISVLTDTHADSVENATTAVTSTPNHSPLLQESHLNKTGDEASGGNLTTQVVLDAGAAIEELQREPLKAAAPEEKIDSAQLVAMTNPISSTTPAAVPPSVPSVAAPSFALSSASIQSPAPLVVVPILPGQAPVSPTVPSNAAASPAVAPKAASKVASERASGVLYLRQTLRSGQAVTHKGDLVIIGDVNPGAEVSAEGDITIWGALRGVAHAGITGNASAEIRALKFDPIQLRIAHAIARAPDRSKTGFIGPTGPETARIVDGKIRISCSDPD